MIVSRNEIATVCHRAGLGVGLPHGLAEDAGAIGARLIASAADGADIMLRAFRFAGAWRPRHPVFEFSAGAWRVRNGPVSALHAGPMAADFLSAGLAVSIDASSVDEPAILEACLDGGAARPALDEISVSDGVWNELARLAARTYVPATAASRMQGAGAGLHDSD